VLLYKLYGLGEGYELENQFCQDMAWDGLEETAVFFGIA
jgi:hypothetical protein